MIRLEQITVRFGERTILDGIDLEVRDGETLVVLGASGSGKSTILRVIIGLVKPDSGRVIVDGEDITDYNEVQWNQVRRKMGMVFQYSALFDSMTVAQNVAFGLERNADIEPARIPDIVADKLAKVGMTGWEDAVPGNLSGGMKKRVGLARAIATDPTVILYDEPTAGLDPIRAATVDRLIRNAQQDLGATSIVVTHELVSAERVADRMALLHEGQFVEIAPTQEFLQSENLLVQQFLRGEESIGEGMA